ncbi:J domain-containing protein [Methylocucumis oryzae]|uniref:J domain-containing protein n=1 Tax=Methylocucumis oryzae TaxID=1632867 RepID=UPI000696333D|nr:J domain-containing protein [Methylocucumis oryzae]
MGFARLLDKAYHSKGFSKTDKKKLSHLITELTADILAVNEDAEIMALHDQYSDVDFNSIKQDSEAMAGDLFKSMFESHFGVDLGDDFDISNPDEAKKILEETMLNLRAEQDKIEQQEDEAKPAKKKTAKQLAKEEQERVAEENISKSIREVYRKLTSECHPDREPDETERARKTELMQRINAAYAKKDLLALLELQLELAQIDTHYINNLAEDRLNYINQVLEEQLMEIEDEIQVMSAPFKMKLDLAPWQTLSSKQMLQAFKADIAALKREIVEITNETLELQDFAELKRFLKSYDIPKPGEDDFYDLLMGL